MEIVLFWLLTSTLPCVINCDFLFNQAIDMVKKTPAYKNKLRALELQRTGGMTNRKKGNKPMDKYEHMFCSLTMQPESSGLA